MSTRLQDSDASRPLRPASSFTNSALDHDNNKLTSLNADRPKYSHGDASAMEDLLRPPIIIKPHPPKLTIRPRSLQPLMLIPREHLRLSFLDLSSPYGSFESSPAFESNIRILDLESRMGNRPVVLIARLESNKTVYALERQENTLYTLCHLGSWVDLERLCDLATVSCPGLMRKQPAHPAEPIAPRALTTPQTSHVNQKRKLAIEAIQSLVKKPAASRSILAPLQNGEVSGPSTPSQGTNGDVEDGSIAEDQSAPPSGASLPTLAVAPQAVTVQDEVQDEGEALDTPNAEGIFDNIRNHYFEALYHSMGSLAYFAKGPLSRARAAFHLDCESSLEMNDLIEFLKSLVLTTVQIDKKYREAIPRIQSEMKHAVDDTDDDQGHGKSKPRKRKVKKMKIGKDGLYPNEDEHVRKWWTVHQPLTPGHEESTTKSTEVQDIKFQISRLRSRETQLQMIILLEILALEPLLVRDAVVDTQLPGLPLPEDSLEPPKEMPIRKRNKHNIPLLLDVHADRLCIWQSIALDEFSVVNESQMGSRPESRQSTSTSDPLKDFCVDIIVPFFSARLPEYCNSINRKLGGPVMMSPARSQKRRPEPVSKAKSMPGAVAKRAIPPKSSRTLEKFLSKETERNRRSVSRGPGGVIALMRSASTPTAPLLKREASEPLSLASIPKADSRTSREKQVSSAGIVPAKRRWTETKEKRDAFVKAELQDAISTLRRPNRGVAVKAMVEADERRATTSLSQLRKSRKPTQHPQLQSIVKATPVGTRFHDALAKGFDSHSGPVKRPSVEMELTLPSSSMVPSSAPRKRDRETAFGSSSATQPRACGSTTDQIMVTPAKCSTRNPKFLSAPSHDEGDVLASSPVMSHKISQPSFVAKSWPAKLAQRDSGIEMPSSPGGPEILAQTPLKQRQNNNNSMEHYITVTPVKKRVLDHGQAIHVGEPELNKDWHDSENKPKREMTIFERLGWMDDDCE